MLLSPLAPQVLPNLAGFQQRFIGHASFSKHDDHVNVDEKCFLDFEESAEILSNRWRITPSTDLQMQEIHLKSDVPLCGGKAQMRDLAIDTQEPAKRSSKNRAAGTMVTKNTYSVTKDQYSQMIIERVIPVIRCKWPNSTRSAAVVIQQDYAKPHISPSDIVFNEANPDTNVFDLGFFNAIFSLQHQKVMDSIDKLIAAVQAVFIELDRNTLSKVFLTHQSRMNEILKCGGENKYDFPFIEISPN
ncbi:hypothetical protein CCR75_004019 [Bremia lactucae]|uniref:Uncharacterized protein n=1 Tax=Bremia lactucae TaxID=4779 RepID=A0A976IB74_BRELC|nr:hypothetical protein CCR75_004019 [Bremia lactucae]